MAKNNIVIVSITYEQHEQLLDLQHEHILLSAVREISPQVAIEGYQMWLGRIVYGTLPDYIKQILLM